MTYNVWDHALISKKPEDIKTQKQLDAAWTGYEGGTRKDGTPFATRHA